MLKVMLIIDIAIFWNDVVFNLSQLLSKYSCEAWNYMGEVGLVLKKENLIVTTLSWS